MIAKKSFGQNFLSDKNIVSKIVEAAEVVIGDLVLEIGPGQGILTEALLEAGAKVIAVEADKDLIPALQDRFGKKIELVFGDILSNEVWQKIYCIIGENKYSVVANIPYNITSPLLEKLFKTKPKPKQMTLMVQREVADRLLAIPPKTSVLSIACQLYAKGKKVLQVGRGAFWPVPKVDSTVIRLDLRSEPPGGVDPEKVLKIVKAGFSMRRKQLHHNLAAAKICSSLEAKIALKRFGLDEKSRAENLRVEDWLRFCKESTPQ